MFESINKAFTSTVKEGMETKDFEIKKLKECVGEEHKLYGYIITKPGKFGKGVLLVTEKFYISLPKREVEKFENFTPEEIEALKSGEWKITDIKPIDSSNGPTTTYTITLV